MTINFQIFWWMFLSILYYLILPKINNNIISVAYNNIDSRLRTHKPVLKKPKNIYPPLCLLFMTLKKAFIDWLCINTLIFTSNFFPIQTTTLKAFLNKNLLLHEFGVVYRGKHFLKNVQKLSTQFKFECQFYLNFMLPVVLFFSHLKKLFGIAIYSFISIKYPNYSSVSLSWTNWVWSFSTKDNSQ